MFIPDSGSEPVPSPTTSLFSMITVFMRNPNRRLPSINDDWKRTHSRPGKSADFSGVCQLVHVSFTQGDRLGPPGSTQNNTVVTEHCFSDMAPPYQGCSSRLAVTNNASLARFVAACSVTDRTVHLWITFGTEQMKLSHIASKVSRATHRRLRSGYAFWKHICSFVLCVTSYVLHKKGKVTWNFHAQRERNSSTSRRAPF